MSIKRNFAYNTAITVSSYIASFITFPYVSRILGVDNLGVFSYVDNVINYYVLFIMMGVQMVGIREVASSGPSIQRRSEVVFSLITFLLLTTTIVGIVYTICIFNIPQLSEYKELFKIGYVKLLFTPLMMEWVFSGMQNFKFISTRTVLIKILYVLCVFLFVRQKEDLNLYYLLTCSMSLTSFIINAFAIRKFISFNSVRIQIRPYVKPILKLGFFSLIVSLYTSFNYIYLRNVSNETELGLYYTAIKLYSVILALFIAFNNVMLPKVSELLNEKNNMLIYQYIQKSFIALFTLCFPIIIYTILLAPFIISLIAGEGYEDAILPMRIVMPLLLFAGLNQINGVQVLTPMKKDNVLLFTSILSALTGVICNIIFTKVYGAIGCAMVVFVSEFVGCISGYYYSIKNKLFEFPFMVALKHLIICLPYFFIYGFISYFFGVNLTTNIIITILFFLYFIVSQLFILKNSLISKLLLR